MKLELKHLAGYLPYGLQIEPLYQSMGHMGGFQNKTLDIGVLEKYEIEDIKPILRPLSYLTKHCDDLGFVPIEWLRKEYSGFFFENNPELLIKSKNTSMYISFNWTNEILEKLYEWHFDIYGLIEKNLAIDKNTIK